MHDTLEYSLALRLRTETHGVHDRLDQSIMAAASFSTLEGYGRFLRVQGAFHRDIDALYDVPELAALLPGLAERRRSGVIAQDLADLGLSPLPIDEAPRFMAGPAVDVPLAVGWLYVAEGSNLGAALLRKEAAKLGLSDDHGARHLAPAAEGPAAHWRAFTGGLNAIPPEPAFEARAIEGAKQAFARVQSLVGAWLV
jgi:heme oxygenase (biliverdin-IX-beta and delta-forming)